jgi:hypothetical protein
MKPIKRDGKLYRYAYWLETNPPTQTNLCHFVGHLMFATLRNVIIVGMALGGAFCIGFVLYTWGWGIAYNPLCRNLTLVGVVITVLVVLFFLSSIRDTELYQVIAAWVMAKKAKMCPIITFE